MAYIVAAAILALLVIGFTRRTVVVLAALVAAGFLSVGIYLAQDAARKRAAAARNDALVMTAGIDASCRADMPLRISLQNTSDRQLDAVSFDISGYRDGHSIPLYRTRGYLSDRILPPGAAWSDCHPLPQPIRGTDTRALETTPPSTLRWTAENLSGRFSRS